VLESILVYRIWSFSGQAFELELLRQFEQLVFVALQFFREFDVTRGFFQKFFEQLTTFNQRSGSQISSLKEEQIKGVIDEGCLLVMSVSLEELERGSSGLVQRNYLAIESCGFGG
jgi:hypothetical protein